jgi:hypothetical protein
MGVELDRLVAEARESFFPASDWNSPAIRRNLLAGALGGAEDKVYVDLSREKIGSEVYFRGSSTSYVLRIERHGSVKLWKDENAAPLLGPVDMMISEIYSGKSSGWTMARGIIARRIIRAGDLVQDSRLYLPNFDYIVSSGRKISVHPTKTDVIEGIHILYAKAPG